MCEKAKELGRLDNSKSGSRSGSVEKRVQGENKPNFSNIMCIKSFGGVSE